MRQLIIAILILFSVAVNAQLIPIYYLKADTTGGLVPVVGPDSILYYYHTDSLGTSTDNQNLGTGGFSTSTGVLTVEIEDGTNQTTDLDGRYILFKDTLYSIDSGFVHISTSVSGSPDTATVIYRHVDSTTFSDPWLYLWLNGGKIDSTDLSSLSSSGWTIDGDDADTEVITTQTVKFEGGGITTTDYDPATNKMLITSTEGDGSPTNEAWTVQADDLNSELITTQVVGFRGGGITTTTYDAGLNRVDITSTEVNDLTAAVTWDDVPDANITESSVNQHIENSAYSGSWNGDLSGTSKNTIYDKIQTMDDSETNEAWTIDGDDADTEVISNQTVKFEGGGITTTDYDPTNDKLIITSTELDGSTSNELQRVDTLRFSGGNLELSLLNDGVAKSLLSMAAYATQSALNDTASAIRADFPAGGGGGGTVKGTGVANRFAYWVNSDSLTNDADAQFDGTKATFGDVQTNDGVDFGTVGTIWKSGNDIRYKATAGAGFHLFYDDSDALMFHLYNSTGDGRFYNNLGIGGNPTYALDVFGGSARVANQLGLNGRAPNASYAIHANGHAIFYNGSDYAYLRSGGELQMSSGGTRYDVKSLSGDFWIQRAGVNVVQWDNSESDLVVYGDMEVETTGDDHTTIGFHIEDDGASTVLDVRNDGGVEGEAADNYIYTTAGGVVPRTWLFGDFTEDPHENNILCDAEDKFTVSITNVNNSLLVDAYRS